MASTAPPSQGIIHSVCVHAVLCGRIVLHISGWNVRLPNIRLLRGLRLLPAFPYIF